jgi:hypothetical protein
MKARKVKPALMVRGGVLMGRERANGEGERGQIWSVYFVYVYENRRMNPEIVLRKEEEEEGE